MTEKQIATKATSKEGNSLRIGLVSGEFPPLEGGVGAFTRELALALADQGHEISVFTTHRARPTEVARSLSTAAEPVDQPYGRLVARGRRWHWGDMNRVADTALRYALDVVNIQYQAAAYSMKIPAINWLPWRLHGLTKTVVTFHDLRVPYLFPKAGRLRQWPVRRLAQMADGVIVTNRDDMARLSPLIPPHTLRRIPIGSNITVHRPDEENIAAARSRLGVPSDAFLLGFFGFLNESKGADTLVRAMTRLSEAFHLVFIGGLTGQSDPQNNEATLRRLRALIVDSGLEDRVHWTGFVDDEAVSSFLHAADVMIMPYRDGVSLRRGTLMAVLAHGRPLITTHPQYPIPELVDGANVKLVRADDAGALAETIIALQRAPERREALSQGASLLADSFSWEKIADQTITFFNTLLSSE